MPFTGSHGAPSAPTRGLARSDVMIIRTDAVVLRTMDYGETSRIATLLTRSHGVVGMLARGARRPTSQFGSTLQPMSAVEVVFYHRPGRGLQTLKETAYMVRWRGLTADFARVPLGLRAVEVARAVLGEGEAHPLALDSLVRTLAYLDSADEPANAVPWFQLRLAALLGFAPDIQREDVLALGDEGTLLLESGAVAPLGGAESDPGFGGTSGFGGGVRASRAALRAFAVFARTDLDVAGRMALTREVRREAESLVDGYLRTHTDSPFREKVREVTDQLDAGLEAGRGASETE